MKKMGEVALFFIVYMASITSIEMGGWADGRGHQLAHYAFWIFGMSMQAVSFWMVARGE